MIARYYYEAHVTIEPVFGEDLRIVASLTKNHKFKVADLLMQKRKEDTPDRSKFDTFATGHGKDYDDLKSRVIGLVEELKEYGYKVWRYKIEDTLLDSKFEDELEIL